MKTKTNVDMKERRETNQLHLCHVGLPPQKLLVGGAHCSEKVVAIHEHMDERVEHGAEVGSTTRDPANTNKPKREHAGVMVYVQEGHLVVLFAENEYNLESNKQHEVGGSQERESGSGITSYDMR